MACGETVKVERPGIEPASLIVTGCFVPDLTGLAKSHVPGRSPEAAYAKPPSTADRPGRAQKARCVEARSELKFNRGVTLNLRMNESDQRSPYHKIGGSRYSHRDRYIRRGYRSIPGPKLKPATNARQSVNVSLMLICTEPRLAEIIACATDNSNCSDTGKRPQQNADR